MELLNNTSMGVINWYYYLAYEENERRHKEAEKQAEVDRAKANNKNSNSRGRKVHPSQGTRIPSAAIQELADEIDEEGGL